MKKVTLLGLVVILLAFSVAPAMAAGPNNGHGNNGNSGHGNGGGDRDQTKQQSQSHSQSHGRGRFSISGMAGKGNQGSSRMRTPFYLQGTIKSIDTISETLTISVTHGNAQVKQYIGAVLTLSAADTERIFKITQGDDNEGTESVAPTTSSTDEDTSPSREAIEFGDLKVGNIVAIHGNVVEGDFKATLITVYVKNIGEPEAETP